MYLLPRKTIFYVTTTQNNILPIYVSQFAVETYCFADGRCLFKQPQSGISMTRRFQKSVGPSVCPFVTLTKKAYSSFIIDCRKIIRISDERVWHPLQENEAIFSEKIFFKKFRANFRKFLHLLKMPTPPSL